MSAIRRQARLNVKALMILVLVFGIVGVGLVGGHYVRKRVVAGKALVQGREMLARENWPDACKHLRRYLKQYPDDVETLEVYAKAQLAVRPREPQNIMAAAGAYRRLLRHRRGDKVLSNRLATLYVAAGDHENARYICESRLAQDPTDAKAAVLLARLLLERNELEEAAKRLKPLVNGHDPEALDAYSMLCRITLDTDETDEGVTEALSWLNLAVKNNPDAAQPLIDRGVFHRDDLNGRKTPDLQKSRADLDAAERLHPEDPDQRLRLASTWMLLGELTRAKAILDTLADVDDEVFLRVMDEPKRFQFDRYRVAAALYRRIGDPQTMGDLADRALSDLAGRRRAAFLPSAVELYVEAGRAEDAQRVLDEYQTLIDKATHGRSTGDADLAVLRARVAMAADRPFDVINVLRPVLVWQQESVPAWRLLAEAYLKTDQRDLAMAAMKEAADRGGQDVALISQLAREHLRRGDEAEALRLARICENLKPDLLDLKLMRIEAEMRVAFNRTEPSDALAGLRNELNALSSKHPDYAPVQMLEASLAERTGDIERAEALLRQAVETRGDTMDAFTALVRLLERTGRADEALDACRTAMKRHPNAAGPWIYAAQLELAAERPDDARETLQKAVDTVTDADAAREVRQTLARLQLMHFDRAEGIATLESMAERDPADVAARTALLEMPEILENAPAAQRYIDELKSIEGTSGLWWRLHQSRFWLANGAWREHADEIREAMAYCIKSRPQWWTRASLLLGRLHEQLGNTAAAEETYRQALAVDPNAVDVVDRLLGILQTQGRFADARDVLDRVTLPAPELSGHRVGIAIGTGAFDTAIRELETRVAADPNAAEPRIILASLYYSQQHDVERAFALLDEATVLKPKSLAPVAVRSRILVAEDRADEALALLDREVAARGDFETYALRAEFHMQHENRDLAEKDYRRLTELADGSAIGYELLGRFFLSTDRRDEAIHAWEQGLAIEPSRETLKRRLMKAMMSSGDASYRERGRVILDELLAVHPDDVELLRVHAFSLYTSESPQARKAALKVLERVVQKDPSVIGAHLALVDTQFRNGDYERAGALVTRALEANPKNPSLLTAAARIARAAQKESVARGLARSALDADPGHVPAYIFLIDDALQAGKLDDAEALVRSVSAIAPNDPVVRIKNAALLELEGENKAAIDILQNLLESDADVNRLLLVFALADLNCAEGDMEQFESRLHEAVDLTADPTAVMETHLRCLARRQRFDEITPLISKHDAEHPEDLHSMLLAGELLTQSNARPHFLAARALFEQVVARDSRNIPAYLGIAKAAYLAGDIDAVIKAYRGVLAIKPDHQRALNDLAWVLVESGRDLEEALQLVDRGIEHFPADPHLRDTRGVVLLKLGRLDPAIEELKRAVDFSPQIPATRAKAMMHLADAYVSRDEPAAAREQLIEARRIDERHDALSDSERAKIANLLEHL